MKLGVSYRTRYRQIIKKNKVLVENFSYISALQIFLLLSPLITYPYLVRVLGRELYGWVITAQVIAGYCSLIVDFGFKSVSAKHVSIYRENKDKLSEILSSVLLVRFLLWFFCFIVYTIIVYQIDSYREHIWLFLFSFGITFNELLFPQFFFQGIEKMKYIAILNIGIRLFFLLLIFIVVKETEDYVIVPLLSSIGYFLGGVVSLYVIFFREGVRLRYPGMSNMLFHVKDASPIFVTDVICSIKDRLNYILLGSFVGMSEVVIYDLGSKFTNMLVKPINIVSTVFFPRMAKERNVNLFKRMAFLSFVGTVGGVELLNLVLPNVTRFFVDGDVDLLPIRLYLFAPIFLGLSGFIASNFLIALGYNKYILYSIIVTTGAYVLMLLLMYFGGTLHCVSAFVGITVISYFVELVYRLFVVRKILKNENDR